MAFPHHEAEIAQAEATTGIKPYVKYWVHTGLLTINKMKMSKSLGNFIRVVDALDKDDPETLRLWMAMTHYRKPLDYNDTDLEVAKKKVERIATTLEKIKDNLKKAKNGKPVFVKKIEKLRKKFFDAMDDDMNTSLALANFFEIISLVNKKIEMEKFSKKDLTYAKEVINELGQFFQIIPEIKKKKLSSKIKKMIDERETARKKKDWKRADEIRTKLKKMGILLEDTPDGIKWKFKKD